MISAFLFIVGSSFYVWAWWTRGAYWTSFTGL